MRLDNILSLVFSIITFLSSILIWLTNQSVMWLIIFILAAFSVILTAINVSEAHKADQSVGDIAKETKHNDTVKTLSIASLAIQGIIILVFLGQALGALGISLPNLQWLFNWNDIKEAAKSKTATDGYKFLAGSSAIASFITLLV